MLQGEWFYRTEEEFQVFYEKLKLLACPRCHVTGMLILHGFLRGYDEKDPRRRTVRAHRIFCSNRNRRAGCGRTFSVFLADKIRRLSLSAGSLWKFLKLVVADASKAAAIRALGSVLTDRALYKIWNRFDRSQSTIRTALSQRFLPPKLPRDSSPTPAAEVLAHMEAAFGHAPSPIAAFQHSLRKFFL